MVHRIFYAFSSILQVAATQLATKSQRLLGHRAVSMARGVSTHRGDGGLCQVGRFSEVLDVWICLLVSKNLAQARVPK